MAITITKAYVDGFQDSVRHLSQQMNSKLRGTTMERAVNTQSLAWDRMASVNMTTKSSARTATPTADTPWSRRVSTAATQHIADTFEPEDLVQMLIDPQSPLVQNMAMAGNRAWDDIIIAAATAAALDGDGNTNNFPSGQEVGDYTTEISFDVMTEIQELFMTNDIDPDVPKFAVVGPKQVRKLMQLTENTSSDYVQAQALQRYGIVPNWMGFTWIYSNRLLAPNTDQLDCLFYTQRAIGLQVNKDIWTRVSEDPTISYAYRVYCALTGGAVRVEDEQIVRFKAADTV